MLMMWEMLLKRRACQDKHRKEKKELPFGEIETSGVRPEKVTVTSVALLSTFNPRGNRRTLLWPASATHRELYFSSKVIP